MKRNRRRAARPARMGEARGVGRGHAAPLSEPTESRAWTIWRDATGSRTRPAVLAGVSPAGAVLLLDEPPPLGGTLPLCLHGARGAAEVAWGLVTAVEPLGGSAVPGGTDPWTFVVPVAAGAGWAARLAFEGGCPAWLLLGALHGRDSVLAMVN